VLTCVSVAVVDAVKMEVGTRETDWSLNLPYYVVPQMEVWHRWDGGRFTEVARIKNYTEGDVAELRTRLATDVSKGTRAAKR
jgi:hypothetical protein